MKKSTKVALSVSLILVILILVWVLPFSFVFKAWNTKDKNTQLNYLKNAVKCSIFATQKAYAIEALMPVLVISKNYNDAIKYYTKYKKISTNREVQNAMKHLAVYSYMQTENYNTALELAKELNNRVLLVQIYTKLDDLETAKSLIVKEMNEHPDKMMNFRYLAEIQMKENKWKEAEISINKINAPENLDILKDKAEISKHLGKIKEYNAYIKQIQEIEQSRTRY